MCGVRVPLAPHSPLTTGSSPQIPSVEQQLEALGDVFDSDIVHDLERVRDPPVPGCCWGCAARGELGKSLMAVNCCQ